MRLLVREVMARKSSPTFCYHWKVSQSYMAPQHRCRQLRGASASTASIENYGNAARASTRSRWRRGSGTQAWLGLINLSSPPRSSMADSHRLPNLTQWASLGPGLNDRVSLPSPPRTGIAHRLPNSGSPLPGSPPT